MKETFTIPVMADKIDARGPSDFIRATYFSIECDLPSPGWILELEEREIPFFLVGISGIIWRPIGKRRNFSSSRLISELFEIIEEDPSLFVDVNDIWLPQLLFAEKKPVRGDVYRIKKDLFVAAYGFRFNQVSEVRFLQSCENLKAAITFSKGETEAFKKWEALQIKEAKDQYRTKESLALEWKQ